MSEEQNLSIHAEHAINSGAPDDEDEDGDGDGRPLTLHFWMRAVPPLSDSTFDTGDGRGRWRSRLRRPYTLFIL